MPAGAAGQDNSFVLQRHAYQPVCMLLGGKLHHGRLPYEAAIFQHATRTVLRL
jgi:hypothetical protein